MICSPSCGYYVTEFQNKAYFVCKYDVVVFGQLTWFSSFRRAGKDVSLVGHKSGWDEHSGGQGSFSPLLATPYLGFVIIQLCINHTRPVGH